MFGVVGALIVSRDRRNTIGLLFLWASFLTAFAFLGGEVLTRAVDDGQTGWWVVAFGFASNFGWLFGILPVVFLLPLLFPDGHLPSPRWRPFLWFIVGFLVVIGVGLVLGQRTLTGSNDVDGVANPFYLDAVGRLPNLDPVIGFLFPGIFAASVASLFLRFRRSTGVERQQIKWVVFGLVAALVGVVASGFMGESGLSAVVGGAAFLAFPVSIGIAVLRFHLYDLDVVISKTVIFATVVVSVTAFYLILVVVVGPTAWLGRDNSIQ